MEESGENETSVDAILEKMADRLPKPVRFPLLSSIRHFRLSQELFGIDREMASFRAITGEEEAATALIVATQLRKYPKSERFRPQNHYDKWAVIACVMALARMSQPLLREFKLTFHWGEGRVDLLLPLKNFGVVGSDNLALQPVEPLHLLHKREGKSAEESLEELLEEFGSASEQASIEKMVRKMATDRNKLLYASNSDTPNSKATMQSLLNRQARGQTLLVLAIMVLQTKQHQDLVKQSVETIASFVTKLRGGRAN